MSDKMARYGSLGVEGERAFVLQRVPARLIHQFRDSVMMPCHDANGANLSPPVCLQARATSTSTLFIVHTNHNHMPNNAHYVSSGARTPRSANWSFVRRRRVLLFGTLVTLGLFLFYIPWELPETLHGIRVSRANFLSRVKNQPPAKVDEIYGLLHVATSPDEEQEHVLNNPQLDPTSALDLSVYAPGHSVQDWAKTRERIDKEFPVIVFSKVSCRPLVTDRLCQGKFSLTALTCFYRQTWCPYVVQPFIGLSHRESVSHGAN